MSGATGEGLDELREAIEARFLATLRPMELLVPYEEGGRLSELHDLAGELEREDTPEGVRIRARVPVGGGAALRALRAQRRLAGLAAHADRDQPEGHEGAPPGRARRSSRPLVPEPARR